MKHDLLPVIIDFDYRITPTETGVQVVQPDRHLYRRYRRIKPCLIDEHQRRSPLARRRATDAISQHWGEALSLLVHRLDRIQSLLSIAPARHLELLHDP